MNILMMTNTYKPILGGLEKSIEAFTKAYRKMGQRVIIVAPVFEKMEPEEDLIRIPAITFLTMSLQSSSQTRGPSDFKSEALTILPQRRETRLRS